MAEYLRVDPLWVRIAFVALALMNGAGLLGYLLLWVLIPAQSAVALDHQQAVRRNADEIGAQARRFAQDARATLGGQRELDPWSSDEKRYDGYLLAAGVVLVGIGLLVLMGNLGLLWWVGLRRLWPLALIALGAVVLLNSLKDRR